jgi:hypothetical protein
MTKSIRKITKSHLAIVALKLAKTPKPKKPKITATIKNTIAQLNNPIKIKYLVKLNFNAVFI